MALMISVSVAVRTSCCWEVNSVYQLKSYIYDIFFPFFFANWKNIVIFATSYNIFMRIIAISNIIATETKSL